MQMMLSFGNQQPPWAQSHGSAMGYSGYMSPGCSVNDGWFSPHHTLTNHQSQQGAFAPEGTMPQGVLNYQFRPISPSFARPASVYSNTFTPSPVSVHGLSTDSTSYNSVYHSL